MDALIMAAGRGSRLGDLTDALPKALISLGDRSALELQIDVLASRGVRRAIIVTGYRAELIRSAAEARARERLTVEFAFNPFWNVTNVLGSAWFARTRLDDDFVYLHADTVFAPSILDDLLASPADVALPVDMRPVEPEQMKAEVVDDLVLELSKALPDERSAGEFIGIGLFRARVVPSLRAAIESEIEDGAAGAYFEAAINRLIAEGQAVHALDVHGRPWTEIDFIEDLEAARAQFPSLLP